MHGISGAQDTLIQRIVGCRRCERLVRYREWVSQVKTRRFKEWIYWGRPVPGFGDLDARLMIVGLAPAAHGANRTGRMFTGDSSGDWLFKALYKIGLSNKPDSISRDDGMEVRDVYITSIVKCPPPENKPNRGEILSCREYLKEEIRTLSRLKIILCLGRLSWVNTVETLYELDMIPVKRLGFRHGSLYRLDNLTLIASYHPSRRNTQTGRLTWNMWMEVFQMVERLLAESNRRDT